MQPGREMDALVAETVMGWTNVSDNIYGYGEHLVGHPPGDTDRVPWKRDFVPAYSTDIAAAWEVFETLTADPSSYPFAQVHRLWLEDTNSWGWGVSVPHWSSIEILGSGATAPEALCRAALRISNETAVKNASSSVQSAEESPKEV